MIEYLIHYIWNVNNLILCKLTFLFLIIKLKLGLKLFQFIHKLKIEIFDWWPLAVLPVFPQFTKVFLDVWMLLWLDFSFFSQIRGKDF